MDLSRGIYSRDLKLAAMRALDAGSTTGEIARKYQFGDSASIIERRQIGTPPTNAGIRPESALLTSGCPGQSSYEHHRTALVKVSDGASTPGASH
jgi:hypothetical protein